MKKDYTRDFFFDPITGTYRDILDSIDYNVEIKKKRVTKREKRKSAKIFRKTAKKKLLNNN